MITFVGGCVSWLLAISVQSSLAAGPGVNTIHSYLAAWNSEEPDLTEVVTEDFVRHGIGQRSAGSRAELEELILDFHNFYSDAELVAHFAMAGDEGGSVFWSLTGTYPVSGESVSYEHLSMVRFEGGKIAEEWVMSDMVGFYRSLGYRLIPPGFEMVPPEVTEEKPATRSIESESPPRRVIRPSAGTLEDSTTGLMWPLKDNGSDVTQEEAAQFCAELSLGHHSDWRLPTVFELETIYDPESTKVFKTIPGITLSNGTPWSSTAYREGLSWVVVFYKGARYVQHNSFRGYLRALCVRDAEAR